MMSFDRLTGVIFSFWAGLVFSLIYAFTASTAIKIVSSEEQSEQFIETFFGQYGGFWTGSLCFMVFVLTILIFKNIPSIIEKDIPLDTLSTTEYEKFKGRFTNVSLAVVQSTIYFMIGLLIYSICQFDVNFWPRTFLTIFTALQFSFGGLLGRKLWCTAYMLRSIDAINPPSNLIETDNLQKLIFTVNIFTFLTFVITLVHTYFHFRMSFQFYGLPPSIASYLPLVPALLALPVLVMFNFIPRSTVNGLYLKSIEKLKGELESQISKSNKDSLNNRKLLIDYKKFLNEEFRYKQRAALSELPVVLAMITLFAGLLVRLLINAQ